MDARPRRPAPSLAEAEIPVSAGVYAFYREGERLYVGKTTSLRQRLWGNHLRRGTSMTDSAFRRNVCQHLGIATAADIKARRYLPTDDDAGQAWEFVAGTEVAWIECTNEPAAVALETRLKSEHRPPLTKK
jgi:excinuclease UvrABC nuclease subunit